MRKYVLRTMAFAALFCALLTVSVFAESAEVTGNDVNFRSGPGTDYSVYDCLPKGTVVTVTDRSDSEWYSVTYNGHSGFIYASYLSIADDPAPQAPAAQAPVEEQPAQTAEAPASPAPAQESVSSGTVNAMYVRLRSGPSVDHAILGEYNSGTAVTVSGSSDGWYAVTINGQSGYMYASYVTLSDSAAPSGDTPAETPAPTPVPTPEPTPIQPQDNSASGAAGHIQGDYVYFRTGPSTSYSILDSYNSGTALTITGVTDGWCAVIINGQSGYVYSAYVVSDGGEVPELPAATPEPTPAPAAAEPASYTDGYITGNSVRFRTGPSTRDDILGEFNYGTSLAIVGTTGDWTGVIINGMYGYVYSQYVAEGSVTSVIDDPNASELGRQIVAFALQYEGYPYVWGGTTPDGFDCSGFTTYVYGHFGISLNRVADDQTRNGVAVDTKALQPGDLLCFYSGGSYVGHVGIYIGNNKFIHASTYTTGVIISELSGYYDTRGFIARRLV